MGQRKSARLKMVLPVKVSGTDAAGKNFATMAYTLDVSGSGARLGGINMPMSIGQEISVQYKQQKARFKVVWVGAAGGRAQDQAGITQLGHDRVFWPEIQPDTSFVDEYRSQERAAPAQPAPLSKEETTAGGKEAAGNIAPEAKVEDVDSLIQSAAQHLRAINQVVKREPPSDGPLTELSDAIASTRQTLWALQQMSQVKHGPAGRTAMSIFLNNEKLRFLIRAADEIHEEVNAGTRFDRADLEALLKRMRQIEAATGLAVDSQAANGAVAPATEPESEPNVPGHAQRLQRFLDNLRQQIQADGVAVALPESGELTYAASSGEAPPPGMMVDVDSALTREALTTRDVVYCKDSQKDPRVDAEMCRAAGIGSVLMLAGSLSGLGIVLLQAFASRPDAFSPGQLTEYRAVLERLYENL